MTDDESCRALPLQEIADAVPTQEWSVDSAWARSEDLDVNGDAAA
jgi:hypothetical protein